MKLILHIGTEKTGTTSIQNFLKLNRIKLKKHGYYIPKSPALPSGNHRWITLIAYDKDRTDDFIKSIKFIVTSYNFFLSVKRSNIQTILSFFLQNTSNQGFRVTSRSKDLEAF